MNDSSGTYPIAIVVVIGVVVQYFIIKFAVANGIALFIRRLGQSGNRHEEQTQIAFHLIVKSVYEGTSNAEVDPEPGARQGNAGKHTG